MTMRRFRFGGAARGALLFAGVLCGLVVMMAAAPAARGAADDPAMFVGSWKVDLRPNPDAPAYYQSFVVRAVEENAFRGTFYGSEIENGRVNTDWGAVHFAFVTRDGSGEYHHSGVLRGGKMEGLSHAVGRRFLAVWTAVPAE